jgi:hypothetical protein
MAAPSSDDSPSGWTGHVSRSAWWWWLARVGTAGAAIVGLALTLQQMRLQTEASVLDRHYHARERLDGLIATLYAEEPCDDSKKIWCAADDVDGLGDCPPGSSIAARNRAAHEALWIMWSEESQGRPIAPRRQLAHSRLPWFEIRPDDHLAGASLMGADLRCAQLAPWGVQEEALPLTGADLRFANLRYARVRGDLKGIQWNGAICPDGTRAIGDLGCDEHRGTQEEQARWARTECARSVQTSTPPFPCTHPPPATATPDAGIP